MSQEIIEKAFLAELEALEKFRISYTAQYPSVPLSHDDPDVRRLIEAMAFFTARTRLAALRSLDDSVRRIFRQHFPSLLGPSPAMAMLRARPGPTFADATELPRGTEVVIRKPPDDPSGSERLFRFRTLSKLRILPLRVQSVDIVPFHGLRSPSARPGFGPAESDEPRRGYRLLIRLVANTAHNQDLRELSLHINHLDDLRSSLTVMHELEKHLRAASVLYDPNAPELGAGQPCEVSFGAPDERSELPEPFESPLQRARTRVRFPRRDLYLNVRGMSPPRNWQHITLCLDLAESWPRKLRLTSDGFELYSVPMINAVRALANPVECNGTKDRYPLRHPDESGEFVPLWAIGAYRPTKSGFVPLEPGVVGTDGDSYEIVTEGKGEERRAFAMLQIAGAFTKPERISVDLFWHQPGLSDTSGSELKVGLSEHFVEGLTWSCSGPVLPDAEAELDDDREAQLELISLKTLRFLGLEELLSLLRACGAHKEPLFAKLVGALDFVRGDPKPFGKRSHGLKYVYEIGFGMLDASDVPRLAAFSRWLLDLLSTWSAEEVIELVTVVPNLGYRETVRGGL